MFDNLTHWQWVAIAWIQLVLTYGGYLFYLNWREKRAQNEDD